MCLIFKPCWQNLLFPTKDLLILDLYIPLNLDLWIAQCIMSEQAKPWGDRVPLATSNRKFGFLIFISYFKIQLNLRYFLIIPSDLLGIFLLQPSIWRHQHFVQSSWRDLKRLRSIHFNKHGGYSMAILWLFHCKCTISQLAASFIA